MPNNLIANVQLPSWIMIRGTMGKVDSLSEGMGSMQKKRGGLEGGRKNTPPPNLASSPHI